MPGRPGSEAFNEQAEKAKQGFSARKQTIRCCTHQNDKTEAEIDYIGILAMDLPNGMKKGDSLRLQGRSIFKFSGDGIVKLTDISN